MNPKLKTYASMGLKALLALTFLMAGAAKLSGAEEMVALYDNIGFGQWFRYLTGGIEMMGAIGMLIPRTSLYASMMLICVMLGACAAHILLIGGSPVPAIILGSLCALIAYIELSKLNNKGSPS